MNPLAAIGVGVVLLALNAFFVAAEFALLAARRSRIEQLAGEGDRRARRASRALRRLSVMLAGAQLGITIASLGLGAVAEPAVAQLLEPLLEAVGLPAGLTHAVAFAVALSIVVLLHMVIGEMAPKSVAITHPERTALRLVGPFGAFVTLTGPALRALNAMANAVVRLFGVAPQDERAMAHSPADLLLLLRESMRQGTVAADDVALFTRALHLSGLQARAAMTPGEAVVGVPATATVAQVEAAMGASGRKRLLVHGERLHDPIGVVHARDLLALADDARATETAGILARPVLLTPPDRPLEALLIDMRNRRLRFAVVLDEGRLAGILTMGDVLEALVGRATA